VDESLARLKVPNLRGLLLHRPEQLLGINGQQLYRALLQLKEAGKVQKIGISVYDPENLAILVPLYQFDIVQAPLNLVDRRLHSSGWLSRLKDYDIEVHTRSAFLQGLLLMSQVAISTRFGQWSYLWDRWSEWLATHDRTAVHACMAYPLSLPEIDRVVVGADSVSQLSQILLAASSDRCHEFPDLQCDAESLINPARWPMS
jgi:aryl-alcohol dehydrogenase-like predicted oxidoreductase